MADPMTPWLSMRLVAGITQREAERRLGWTKRGHLSLIERGMPPTPEQRIQLMAFYGELLTHPEPTDNAEPRVPSPA